MNREQKEESNIKMVDFNVNLLITMLDLDALNNIPLKGYFKIRFKNKIQLHTIYKKEFKKFKLT
jgi:hypothetical protein